MQSTLSQQGTTSGISSGIGSQNYIKSGDRVQLLNHFTKRFVGNPVLGTANWDEGMSSDVPSSHILLPVSKTTSGPINVGDLVRIQTLNPHNSGYQFMYSSPTGYVWYDQLAENNKQFWKIQKEGTTGIGGELKDGDLVFLENVEYPGSRLYEKDGKLCCGSSNHVWEIKSSTTTM